MLSNTCHTEQVQKCIISISYLLNIHYYILKSAQGKPCHDDKTVMDPTYYGFPTPPFSYPKIPAQNSHSRRSTGTDNRTYNFKMSELQETTGVYKIENLHVLSISVIPWNLLPMTHRTLRLCLYDRQRHLLSVLYGPSCGDYDLYCGDCGLCCGDCDLCFGDYEVNRGDSEFYFEPYFLESHLPVPFQLLAQMVFEFVLAMVS